MRTDISNTINLPDLEEVFLPTCQWESYATDHAAAAFLRRIQTLDIQPRCPEVEL